MTKKFQSRDEEKRRKEYKNFLLAVLSNDKEGIKNGKRKGFFISNRLFEDIIMNQNNKILLDRSYPVRITKDLVNLINPNNINVVDSRGLRLLDAVIDLFFQAIDIESTIFAKKYFILILKEYIIRLMNLGAKLNHPIIPFDTMYESELEEELEEIINLLKDQEVNDNFL